MVMGGRDDCRAGGFILRVASGQTRFSRAWFWKVLDVEIIEQPDRWRDQYRVVVAKGAGIISAGYPFIENSRAPFTPARRSLPMMNVALISSAGAYIDGTEAFDTNANDGDFSFREIPTQIDARDLQFAGRGYDESFIQQDINVEVPLARLLEYEANRVIGQLNSVFWSFCGYIPDAASFADTTLPKLVARLKHYDVQGVLLGARFQSLSSIDRARRPRHRNGRHAHSLSRR